jgi:phage regulator Rha-like protein
MSTVVTNCRDLCSRRRHLKLSMESKGNPIPSERIESIILSILGHKVILDRDLAELYGVTTGNLNKAVRRNLDRFPHDFMFQLKQEEYESLRFHFGILKRGQHSKYLPYAFTEQGVAMLSSVLRSKRAVKVNIEIMRAFIQLRQILAAHRELEQKLFELEKKYDEQSRVVFQAIRALMTPSEKPRKKIGFEVKEAAARYAKEPKRK